MKILIVSAYYYNRGGDTRYAFNLASLLRSKGHQVRFFSMKHPNNFASEDEKYFVDYIDFRELNNNKSIQNLFKVFKRSFYYPAARKKIRGLLDEFKPDIVHLQNIHAHITPSIIFEIKKDKIPICWSLHDYKLVCPNSHYINDRTGKICEACQIGKFYKPIISRCKKNSILASVAISLEAYLHKYLKFVSYIDAFICQSEFQAEKLTQNKFPNSKINVIPLFVEKSKIIYSDDFESYFLYFGRIEKFKGVITLLKAIKDLPNINFKIVGSIAESIKEEFFQNLSNNTEYFGFISDELLDNLISKSKAVIVPSENYENQPFAILESFAKGKPVIASKLGGMKELVEKSNGGILFEAGNVMQLADSIKQLNGDDGLRIRLGKNAFNFVNEKMQEEIHYDAILNIYKKIQK